MEKSTLNLQTETKWAYVIKLDNSGEYLKSDEAFFDASTPDVLQAYHFEASDKSLKTVEEVAKRYDGTVMATRITTETYKIEG